MEPDYLKEYNRVVENNPYAAKIGIEILEIRKGYVYARVRKIFMEICMEDVFIRLQIIWRGLRPGLMVIT